MSFEVKDCIKKLHHSGFIVKDLDRSLRFYQETLKMDLENALDRNRRAV